MSPPRQKRYRLYLDESGDHSYGVVRAGKSEYTDGGLLIQFSSYPTMVDPAKRYLGLVGVMVESEVYRDVLQPSLERLKQKYFPHSPDEPIVLHRKELMNAEGAFWRLRDPDLRKAFNEDLLRFLAEQDYRLIMVVLDKQSHLDQYGDVAFHPYNYCLLAMLQRYCGLMARTGWIGDALAESRGGTEDRQLAVAYQHIYKNGGLFLDAAVCQRVLTSRELKLKLKTANVAGLQVADLLAHPLRQEMLVARRCPRVTLGSYAAEVCKVVDSKLNRHFDTGKIEGYGRVYLWARG